MTRAELGQRVTPAEFTRWMGFYSYEAKVQKDAAKRAARSR